MELSAKGLAADTVRKIVQAFASGIEAAVEDGLIPRSPARGVPLPKAERHEMRFLDVDQVYRLADAIDPQYRAFVLAGAYAGCRFGELAAWRVGRLDMLRRKVTIT